MSEFSYNSQTKAILDKGREVARVVGNDSEDGPRLVANLNRANDLERDLRKVAADIDRLLEG